MQAWGGLVRARSSSRFGWVRLVLVVGLAPAVAAMSAGAPAASMAPRLASLVRVAPRAEFGPSQAPAGLRAAVHRTLGARAESGGWSQQAKLTASGGGRSNRFGRSVAVSGSTAVVGAPSNNSGRGAAYVFVRSRTGWSKQAKLTASDAASGDHFGASVAVSGSTVVVGAPGKTFVGSGGAAYVFVRSGMAWSKQAKLSASHAYSFFGSSVAISGSTAVIGAYGVGVAYVFVRSGTVWARQAKWGIGDASSGFGYSVAISGSTAVVGEPNLDTGDFGGSAYVFVRSGTAWSQQTRLSENVSYFDGFGDSVAISGSTAVIGAPFQGPGGVAYVFVRSGTGWSQQATLTISHSVVRDFVGSSVAISGSTAVIGDPGKNSDTGAAYVFVRSGTAWFQQAKLTASDRASGDGFGSSVASSGSTALVGAPHKDSNVGAAYVFANTTPELLDTAPLKPSILIAEQ